MRPVHIVAFLTPVLTICCLLLRIQRRATRSTLLRNTAFLETHDAATGYMASFDDRDSLVRAQTVALSDQLSCGARALDIRVWDVHEDGQHVMYHHGTPAVGTILEESVNNTLPSLVQWSGNHPSELVLLLVGHCRFGELFHHGSCTSHDASVVRAFQEHVPTETDCAKVNSWTLAEATNAATMPNGGKVLAIFECTSENWDPSIGWHRDPPPEGKSWQALWKYVDESLRSKVWTTLFSVQSFWQEEVSLKDHPLHYSIVGDNLGSHINSQVEARIRSSFYRGVNLLEINNICARGPEISDLLGANVTAEDREACAQACAKSSELTAPSISLQV
eukprot:gnl/TRDRNA2_/TRDRNA2_190175_c0_seq1.p1 gnl/TRDRNA2_/TRDRNA2_190175_c0~~gnl/TRDRNA2_/TRDRNA2_190175_c0_seq1.p1  ORF type:complete len:334 (+),score=40.98 gnl/TRDRNA2_/TRDRNA2_190175_c0_seq1:114-1115(+)